jgi:zinc/manganese transport system substrate-binding protein
MQHAVCKLLDNRQVFSVRNRAIALCVGLALAALPGLVHAAPLSIVAAESVYGDLARQIGGDAVSVTSILNNPAQDPHLFEADASAARAVARAGLVIYNGADYDPWMPKLLSVTGGGTRTAIVAAELMPVAPGGNPHLWYDPAVMPLVAKSIADSLSARDPSGAAAYGARLEDFDRSMGGLMDRIAAMKTRYAGVKVTATEPVFDYMARAIGLDMRNAAFQRAIMNDTEPSARDVAVFEDDLRGRKVRVLLYNTQAAGTLPQRMRRIAEEAKIPVVGISETEPPNIHYQDWMAAQLDALDKALTQ